MKKSLLQKVFITVDYIIMTIITFLFVYPFYYLFIYSISAQDKAYGNVFVIPVGLDFGSYIGIFKIQYIYNAIFISISRTVLGTILTVICSTFFAFMLKQKDMPFRKLIYRFVIVTMYFSPGLIPWYLTMRLLGLRNNFLLYILPSLVIPFYVVIVRTYLSEMPDSLEESAKIDGAGFFEIFFKIIIPVSKPIIVTVAIFAAIAQWNAWADTYFLVSIDSLKTLQLVLYEYLMEATRMAQLTMDQISSMAMKTTAVTPESIKMAVTIIVAVPILIVYPLFQKHIAKGLMIGAIKG